jgi:polyisoprenoid-binding protein YceI
MPRSLPALVVALLLTITASAQETWTLDPPHSSAQFSVRHLGVSTVRGAFTKVSGTVKYDANNLAKSSIQTTIDAASVDTRVDMRDNDLRSANFLDVQKYPAITFASKKIEAAGAGKLKATGDLTIHGVTKEDPWGNMRMGASATTKINRNDFGVSGRPGMVGDEITITLDIEMIHPLPK